jgi:hypothetical protein
MTPRDRARGGAKDPKLLAFTPFPGLSRLFQGCHDLPVQQSSTIGGSHQRPRHDTNKAQRFSFVLQFDEVVRVNPAIDRVMVRRWTQVLRNREDLATSAQQVAHYGGDFRARFTKSEDQIGFGDEASAPSGSEHVEGPLKTKSRPDSPENRWDGLRVVSQHLRSTVEDLREKFRLAVEVGNEQLNPAVGGCGMDLPYGFRVQPSAAIVEVVTRNSSDGGVAQSHGRNGFGDTARLAAIGGLGLSGVDLAEVASPRAAIAPDEERGLTVFPALIDVRATGLLSDGM